jgi:hypothetical protein
MTPEDFLWFLTIVVVPAVILALGWWMSRNPSK